MAVTDADVEFRYSETTGPTGDTNPGDASGSLGGYLSTDQIVGGTLHNLFSVLSGVDNAASAVHYRCVFVANTSATDTWGSVVVWIQDEVTSGASVAIGLDAAGVVDSDSSSAQAAIIGTEDNLPSGVTFTTPTTAGTGLAVGSIGPGQCAAVWVRRTAANTAAVANDGATLRFQGAS